MTLDEALQLEAEATPRNLISEEQHWENLEWQGEARAEQEAELGWLRYQENLGWEESYLESLVESGLISRY